MRAVSIDQYGGTEQLKIVDIEKPDFNDRQLLIEVYASSINPIDAKLRDGTMKFRYGKDFPKVLGFDFSGVVVAVGKDVTGFDPGDEVFARSDNQTGEAQAEFVAVSAAVVAHKPAALSHQQAASIPLAGLTALQGLRDDCQLHPGQRVLIIGASGGVGSLAVQIARLMGADVSAVCSGHNVELVRGLGAHRVIDYLVEPVFEADTPYDAIYDVVGSQTFSAGREALARHGHYAAAVPSRGVVFGMFIGNRFRAQKARFVMCKPSAEDLAELGQWLEDGELVPLIDSVFTLDEIAAAHQRIATQRARGKIVIQVKDTTPAS